MASRSSSQGIQPTGRKHLGNYIGAIRQYVEGQDRGDPAIFCIVDLHAISVAYDPAELRERLYDTAAILLAAGLDPERCIFFRQSDVREHSELTWLLSAVTSHGDLNRMTQFKDKSAKQRELVSAALFFYPVLMAADVLAYRATEVPVGDDQRQHVELMREIARRFNERFGETLVVPEMRIPEVGARIMDLQEPERKMSTTGGTESGTVLVLDEPDAIRKKFGSAVTDSGREVRRGPDKPGITNLIDILRGRPRHRPGGGRARVRGRRLRRLQEGRGRGRGRVPRPRSASATPSCAPTRRRWRRSSPPAPRRPARSPRRSSPTSASAWASASAHSLRSIAKNQMCTLVASAPVGVVVRRVRSVTVAELDLDLDVFAGPFDLLMAVVLREEVSLLEVELAEVVVAYVEHLERESELELDVATEFLVLIASLLELKSRLLLPGEEEELEDRTPEEAVEELVARLLEYRRYRDAAAVLEQRFEAERGYLYRSAPLPPELRKVALDAATAVYDPERLGAALGDLLAIPPELNLDHIRPTVSLEKRLRALREALRGHASIDFDEQFGERGPPHPGGHALRPARDVPQRARRPGSSPSPSARSRSTSRRSQPVSDLTRTIEALLFLSPQPVNAARPGRGDRGDRGPGRGGDRAAARGPRRGQARRRPARGRRRLRPGQRPRQRGRRPPPAGQAAHAAADPGPGGDAGDRRLPAAGHPARGGAHPRRHLRVGGADAWPSAA